MATKYQGPADRLELYDAAIATLVDVDVKGAANPYTSLNGHMASFLDATGSMGLRLSADDRAEFIATYDSALAEQYGRTMKEFIVVPDSLLDDAAQLAPWMQRGNDWISTLKPKKTTRK